jgi:hypothetical protein
MLFLEVVWLYQGIISIYFRMYLTSMAATPDSHHDKKIMKKMPILDHRIS